MYNNVTGYTLVYVEYLKSLDDKQIYMYYCIFRYKIEIKKVLESSIYVFAITHISLILNSHLIAP